MATFIDIWYSCDQKDQGMHLPNDIVLWYNMRERKVFCMEKYIDSHAHYQARQFRNRKELLEELKQDVAKIINIGSDTDMNLSTLQLVSLWDYIYGMIGYFPVNVDELEPSLCSQAEDHWLILTKQVMNQKIVGIGEIGLDYHWDSVGKGKTAVKGKQARELQKKWFPKTDGVSSGITLACIDPFQRLQRGRP